MPWEAKDAPNGHLMIMLSGNKGIMGSARTWILDCENNRSIHDYYLINFQSTGVSLLARKYAI